MLIGNVEIPHELVEAHCEGRLVLFVGAGASIPEPSGLPSFDALAKRIATDLHFPIAQGDLNPPDMGRNRGAQPLKQPEEFLGRMVNGGREVHRSAVRNLMRKGSVPNDLHKAIVHLAEASSPLRIVTTNLDRHLSTVLQSEGAEFEEFTGPALPLGNDFEGLVYLHGHVEASPTRMVLTDADFGRAYLTDAWSARFLERMFREFSVLFIGYGINDVVMRYMARGLGGTGQRFIITRDPTNSVWRSLGVRPIGYDTHEALPGVIEGWAEVAAMGLLDHRLRVSRIVASIPPLEPEDEAYLQEVVGSADLVGFFSESARGEPWLDWVSAKPSFQHLFRRDPESSEAQWHLAHWFVEHFVLVDVPSDRALKLVAANGGTLGPELCDALGARLSKVDTKRSQSLAKWLLLVTRDCPPASMHWLEYIMASLPWPSEQRAVLKLFEHLTEPIAVLSRYTGWGASFETAFRGTHHYLEETWSKRLQPSIDDLAVEIVGIADKHLRTAKDLQNVDEWTGSALDPLSFRRMAIEPHDFNRHPGPIDVLIDAARDGVDALFRAEHPLASGYAKAWADSDSRLLQRLAIHSWVLRRDLDSTEKLTWLLDTGWLHDHQLRHEVFRLLAEALPTAAEGTVDVLVREALARVDGDEVPHAGFNLLVWMDRHLPGHLGIGEALAHVETIYPELQPRDQPDFSHGPVTASWGSNLPVAVESFQEMLHADPDGTGKALAEAKAGSRTRPGSDWDDWLSLIREVVKRDPEDGHKLLDLELDDDSVLRSVLSGWNQATLTPEQAVRILERVSAFDTASCADGLARMLGDGGTNEQYPTKWAALPESRQLALSLWEHITSQPMESETDDWLTLAINQPAGKLAEFWIEAVRSDWLADEDAWSGLTMQHRDALEQMLGGAGDEQSTQLAEVVCAVFFHFLFVADTDWATNHVLPLLGWSDEPRAVRTWNAFAQFGRWNDRMLDAGLFEFYRQAATRLEAVGSEQRRATLGHLAGIALTSSHDPLGWVPKMVVDLNDEERVAFADAIGDVLGELADGAGDLQWERWIAQYWQDRVVGKPVSLSLDENSAMARWVVHLDESFELGVALVVSGAARFREHDDVLRSCDGLVEVHPESCAQLICHLMHSTEPPWWGGHHLGSLLPRIERRADPTTVRCIREQALRLKLNLGPE